MKTFTTINNTTICDLINDARWRVIYAAPGISIAAARSLIKFVSKSKNKELEILLDLDPEVCRLGYGEIEAIEIILKDGINIRKCSGIRIGVIISDDKAYIFAPTPLLVEEEPEIVSPNAISVAYEQAKQLVYSICPPKQDEVITNTMEQLSLIDFEVEDLTPEIGNTNITTKELEKVKNELVICPPQKFDLARRLRVYHSYVQFVELKLIGCNIERHTITIPPKLLNLTKKQEDQERLKATYRLLGEKSKISGKVIDEKVNNTRKKYVRSLGPRFGSVILRQKKDEFLNEVNAARKELEKFRKQAEKKLRDEFDKCKKELIKILMPGVVKNPPDDLIGSIITSKPTIAQANQYLESVLETVIPSAETFIKDMQLQCDFKDITYEMLKDYEFLESLKKAYPLINWPKPFEEFEVVKEVD